MGTAGLRPRRIGEILDAAIKLYVGNAGVLITAAACVKAINNAYLDRPVALGESVRFGLRRLFPLIVLQILYGIGSGQTLGKKALGIRVISFESGGQLGCARAFVRYVGRIVSAVVVFLGYLWMPWDREKQCWQDKFAGDVVVPVAAYPLPIRV